MPKKPSKRRKPAEVVKEPAALRYHTRAVTARAAGKGRVFSAAEFKARCLSLMDQVRATGAEIIVTKHNRPVARLVPVVDEAAAPFIGRSEGVMRESAGADLVTPVAPDWDEGADL